MTEADPMALIKFELETTGQLIDTVANDLQERPRRPAARPAQSIRSARCGPERETGRPGGWRIDDSGRPRQAPGLIMISPGKH